MHFYSTGKYISLYLNIIFPVRMGQYLTHKRENSKKYDIAVIFENSNMVK